MTVDMKTISSNGKATMPDPKGYEWELPCGHVMFWYNGNSIQPPQRVWCRECRDRVRSA